MRIERHIIDPLNAQFKFKDAESVLAQLIQTVRGRPQSLGGLCTRATDFILCGSVVDPTSPLIRTALRIGAQAYAALFAIPNADEFPLALPLGDEPLVVQSANIDQSAIHASGWLQGFLFCLICRDWTSLDTLFEVPVDLLRQSSTRDPEYRYLLVDALQGWWDNDADTSDRFLAALEATDPERPDISNADYALHMDVPLMACIRYALGESPKVAEALASGLEFHKKYWSETKKLGQSWDGFLSLGLTSVAALAFEKKLQFDIDSEYLPMWMVRGEF